MFKEVSSVLSSLDAGALSLNGTGNNVRVAGTLNATAGRLNLAANNSIVVNLLGAATALVGGCITIDVKYD
jgi:large exoprotein involved in heme utilization and adhesion